MEQLSVGEAARRLSDGDKVIRPRDISDLFYCGALRQDICPLIGNRRIIPAAYLPVIQMALRRAGKLAPLKACAHA